LTQPRPKPVITKMVAPMKASADPEWMCETVPQWIFPATRMK